MGGGVDGGVYPTGREWCARMSSSSVVWSVAGLLLSPEGVVVCWDNVSVPHWVVLSLPRWRFVNDIVNFNASVIHIFLSFLYSSNVFREKDLNCIDL